MTIIKNVSQALLNILANSSIIDNDYENFFCISNNKYRLSVRIDGPKVIITSSPKTITHRLYGYTVPSTSITKSRLVDADSITTYGIVESAFKRIEFSAAEDFTGYIEATERQDAFNKLTEETVEFLSLSKKTPNEKWYFGKSNHSFTISGDRVYFDLHGLPKEIAHIIIKTIEALD